jgi:hypothetical protein
MEACYRDLPTRNQKLFKDLDLSVLYSDDEEYAEAPHALAA